MEQRPGEDSGKNVSLDQLAIEELPPTLVDSFASMGFEIQLERDPESQRLTAFKFLAFGTARIAVVSALSGSLGTAAFLLAVT